MRLKILFSLRVGQLQIPIPAAAAPSPGLEKTRKKPPAQAPAQCASKLPPRAGVCLFAGN